MILSMLVVLFLHPQSQPQPRSIVILVPFPPGSQSQSFLRPHLQARGGLATAELLTLCLVGLALPLVSLSLSAPFLSAVPVSFLLALLSLPSAHRRRRPHGTRSVLTLLCKPSSMLPMLFVSFFLSLSLSLSLSRARSLSLSPSLPVAVIVVVTRAQTSARTNVNVTEVFADLIRAHLAGTGGVKNGLPYSRRGRRRGLKGLVNPNCLLL